MAIPKGHTFDTWVNEVAYKLHDVSGDLAVLKKYWGSLTATQQTALKNSKKAVIDSVITELGLIKTEIDNV